MLDLRLLRFFIAIYEEKNITAAAARCHVSQPSLSAGLRQLEESLGDSLFIRGKKGVEAKDPAHYLYPHAVKLVEEARRLPTLFRQKATRAAAEGSARKRRHSTAVNAVVRRTRPSQIAFRNSRSFSRSVMDHRCPGSRDSNCPALLRQRRSRSM